jgi:stage II sporulation protein M
MIKNIKKRFIRALEYTAESRNYIYLIIILFFISGLFGYLNASNLGMLDEIIKELLESTKNLSGIGLVGFIFKNNLLSALYGLIFGVILGIFPIFNALINGLVIGYVIQKAIVAAGFLQTIKLLPHGIFELPAIFISLGLGLRLGMFVFSKNKKKELKRSFLEGLNAFFLIVLPLLLVAAIIEGTLIALIK